MPKTELRAFKKDDGTIPLVEWLDSLPEKARQNCIVKIERLRDMGFQLRRPDCDYLRDGIYELRAKHGTVNYRVLYAFAGKNIVLLSHGCTKEKAVPKIEIERAMKNLAQYNKNPDKYSCERI
jgi:putative component of toxin-antitoxin plasmid stabilization module